MSQAPTLPTPPKLPSHAPGYPGTPVIDSAVLLQGGSEIVIRHGGREYRLRRTRFDKLILTA